MKKIVVFLIVLIFSLSTISVSIAGKNDKRNRRDGNRYEQRGDHRQYKQKHHRYYKHKKYRHRNYYYRGHWKSRHGWDRHYNKNRHKYRDGKYHRQGGFMMFSFCEREGLCFSFSIKD